MTSTSASPDVYVCIPRRLRLRLHPQTSPGYTFILNRAATVAELTAFRERRRPITLPTATVTTP